MPKRTHDGLLKRCACGRTKWAKCSHPWWFSFHYADTAAATVDGRRTRRPAEHRYSLSRIARARGERAPTTRGEALIWRDRIRNEIRTGRFSAAGPVAAGNLGPRLTFGAVCDQYLKRHVRVPTRRPGGRKMMEILVALARRAEVPAGSGQLIRLEEKPIDAITRADIEAVRAWRREELAAGAARTGSKGGEAGINRLLSRLRHVFSWAVTEGHLPDTPFRRGGVTVVKLAQGVETPRTRRLEPSVALPDGSVRLGEEERLLRHASPHLRALIVAALYTGCRVGELLSLQWGQIRRDERGEPRWLELPAQKTKTGDARVIPIGHRLRAELEMRRLDIDGQEFAPEAFVFGNEVGERAVSVRTAWEATCARAGIAGLHFHDLRREFACRLLESNAALHDVQLFLGHAAISTTSRYTRSTPLRLERALARLEEQATPASFAHDSHNQPAAKPESQPGTTDEIAGKLLN